MAFGHGKDEVVLVNGYNVSSYLSSAAVAREKETAETSAFGDSSKTRIAGLIDGTMSFEGFFDGAASASDEIFENLLSSTTAAIFEDWPQGDAFGAAGYAMEAQETSYEVTGSVGDAVGISLEAESAVAVDRVTSLQSILTDITASGNGSTEDNGAATTAGGSAYLQVVSKVGGTSLDVTLRESTDNFVGDDTLLGTFTQATAGNESERITFTGTVKRYVRAVFVEVGGGTWNANVAIHRG